jgi:hypothetical protein
MPAALSKEVIKQTKQRFIEEAETDRADSAWETLQPLLHAQSQQEDAAVTLIDLVDLGYLSRERSLDVLERVHEAHRTNELLLGLLGGATERARDLDMLNAPPPDSELFAAVVDSLAMLAP